MRTLAGLAALLLLCPASAGQGKKYFPPAEALGGWRSLVTANTPPSPAERVDVRRIASMDADRLEAAKDLLAPHGGSFLVIRRGWIVEELGQGSTQHIASMAKSLTSMSMMRLLDMSDQGAWTTPIGMQDFIFPFFGPAFINSDPSKATIKLEHLFTMSSGLLFHDSPTPDLSYFQTVIRHPMQNTAGTVWTYSSLPVDLMSVMVQNISGQTTKDFFRAQIGDVIGMASFGWQTMGPYTVGSAYAYLAIRDAARPMYLLLRNGKWDGQQIITKPRVALLQQQAAILQGATYGQPNSPFATDPLSPAYYGHLFWTNEGSFSPLGSAVPEDAIYMAGHGTNFALGIPSEDLIVVRLGSGPTPFDPLLFSSVVQAVVGAILPDLPREVVSRPGPARGIRKN